MKNQSTKESVFIALFTALIAAGSFLTIPIGPVPIVLTTMFVILSGLLGGGKIGFFSVLTYLILGLLGLPVFAGGSAGLAKLTGPTGGFLIGYLLGAPLAGFISHKKKSENPNTKMIILGAILGGLAIYLPGLPWLKYSLQLSWLKTIQIGLIPFLPGFIIKTGSAILLTKALSIRFQESLKEC